MNDDCVIIQSFQLVSSIQGERHCLQTIDNNGQTRSIGNSGIIDKDQNKRNRWQSRGMEIDKFQGGKLMNVKVNKGMSFASYLGSLLRRRRRTLLFVT